MGKELKTIFDKETRADLIHRIHSLNPESRPQWGKMNVYQMLKHCNLADEMFLGKKHYKRKPLGYLFGQMAIKNLLRDDRPLGRNAPTSADFKVADVTGDVAAEKAKWIAQISEYEHYSRPYLVHWFFGKMSREQVGQFAYKHADHHLRQFNC